MNRRNFILGLGTAATLSGAASVTGASISGTADASSNFNVIAENNLTIRRNDEAFTLYGSEIANSTSVNYVNTSVSYVGNGSGEGSMNDTIGSGIEDVGGPRLTVDDNEDSSLEMALATPNDATIEANTNSTSGNGSPYTNENGTAPLRIVNNGGQDKTISAEYTYGDDVGTGSLTDTDVAQLFTFSINQNPGGTVTSPGQVSPGTGNPASSGDVSGNQATIPSGEEATVDFRINYSSALEDAIASAASGGSNYDFANNGFANVDLLQTVSFGEVQ